MLVLVTLLLIGFLGLAALAIDLGLLYTARSEAQRAADAGAHAGAGYLMHALQDSAGAAEEAVRVAEANLVRGEWATLVPEDDVEVIMEEQKVRVRVHRTAARENPIQTLFASALGFGVVDVSAEGAAQVWPADGAKCVLPFAVPDRWTEDENDYTAYPSFTDSFDPDDEDDVGTDLYDPYEPENPGDDYTGYSNDDRGYEIQLYEGDPNDGAHHPSWWRPFAIGQGANDLQEAIEGCTDDVFRLDDMVDTEPGAMPNRIKWGFQTLIDEDPTARWNEDANGGEGCVTREDGAGASCVASSPRIRPLVLFDPREPPDQGRKEFRVKNFVGVFVEEVFEGSGNDVRVQVRFMEYMGLEPAVEWHETGGPELKVLRIVE